MNYSCFCGAVMKLILVWTDNGSEVFDLLSALRDELIRNSKSTVQQQQQRMAPSLCRATAAPLLPPRRQVRPICVDAKEKRMPPAEQLKRPTDVRTQGSAVPVAQPETEPVSTAACIPSESSKGRRERERMEGMERGRLEAEKTARQKRWSSTSPKNRNTKGGNRMAPTTAAAATGATGKSFLQMAKSDDLDAKRRAAREKKQKRRFKLRHYQIRQQRASTMGGSSLPPYSSSSSSSDTEDSEDSEPMKKNDRLWWQIN